MNEDMIFNIKKAILDHKNEIEKVDAEIKFQKIERFHLVKKVRKLENELVLALKKQENGN
jgi:hypothetical protein